MSLNVTIELSDNDLDHFIEVLRRAETNASGKTPQQITAAAGQLVESARNRKAPDFIAERLAKLESLINMVHDLGWNLNDEDKARVLTALAYFADPTDVIPDHIPVVGYLDDAIMIELCVRELKHELEAYEDFCNFRKAEAAKHGVDPATIGRAEWLEEQRQELHQRMRRRRERDRSMAGGGSVFRIR
jgi:uncharacterized membrane protein YkvA (DUF1232 family)